MMKRKIEESSENTQSKVNKKAKTQKFEAEISADSNEQSQSREDDLENDSENVEEVSEHSGTTRKKKGKTSFVWNHFSIRPSDDQETEYAHCNYCERY